MKIEHVKISKLKMASYNPRQISNDDMASLVNSIREFGMVEPVVVNKRTGNVTGGHQRIIACKQLSIEEVPVVYVDLDKKKEKVLNLALNRIHGDWDMGKLSVVLEELKLDDMAELSLTGFQEIEIGEILDSQIDLKDSEDNFDAESEASKIKKPKSKRGEVYQLGKHRLMCGDATSKEDVEKLIDGKKADMVFTDPPYGINVVNSQGTLGGGSKYQKKYSKVIGDEGNFNISFLMAFNCPKIIWGGNFFAHYLPKSTHWIVWDKRGENMMGGSEAGTQSDCEIAWTDFDRTSVKKYKHVWAGWFRGGNKKDELNTKLHPTQKPVGLCSAILIDYSQIQNIILDLFGGSGTTLIAATKTNRICYMMEIDCRYIDIIIERWCQYTGNRNIIRDGQPIVWKNEI